MPNTQSYALNRLLAALPPEDYSRVSPHLTFGPLRGRQILQKRSEPLREILFPGRSLCSFILEHVRRNQRRDCGGGVGRLDWG